MQSIPRLSSTSINNKHHHETRAGLGGWRRHRPARSTSDQIPFQRCPYNELSNRFPLGLFWLPGPPGATFTHAFLHISKLCFYRLWQRPPQWLQRWQRAPVAPDKRQTLSPNIPLLLWHAPVLSFSWALWLTPSAALVTWFGVWAGREGSLRKEKVPVLAH